MKRRLPLQSTPCTGLAFADGSVWGVTAGDETAQEIVSRVSAAMQFSEHRRPTRHILVTTENGSDHMPGEGRDYAVCMLDNPSSEDEMVVQLMRFSAFLGIQLSEHGGVLLHAALAERNGRGALLAGPGEVGKTTASRRLKPPWRSLCDDTCLVMRDAQGGYRAHPWPTWSDFLWGRKGGSWPVQQSVPLVTVFLLRQELEDRAGPIGPGEAVCLLLESREQIAPPKMLRKSEDELRALRLQGLDRICALARNVTMCRLGLTIDGAFWREMEKFMPQDAPPAKGVTAQFRTTAEPGAPFHAFYTGPSMNPTLFQGDVMEVKPYGREPVRVGDVIFLTAPGNSHDVVHRVVSASPEGVRTRGDNCCRTDSWVLQPSDIAGRVVAAWRGKQRRPIAGSERGRRLARRRRIWRSLDVIASQWLHPVYRAMTLGGIYRRLLPGGLRPRVVAFRTNGRRQARLLMGERLIGTWDPRMDQWHIRRPFRLFVNESRLPGAAELD